MIQRFVDRYMSRIDALRASIRALNPDDVTYTVLVQLVATSLSATDDDTIFGDDWPDPARITEINHGQYQGTLLFVIACAGYQPDTFWFAKLAYGSCSGCDTLQGILMDWGPDETEPRGLSESQVARLLTLCLHILQRMHELAPTD